MKTNVSIGLLILRLSVGIMLLIHGVLKLYNGVGWIAETLSSKGYAAPLAYFVFMGELFAAILLICGFRTKFAALLISLNMLIAILLVHLKDIASLTPAGGWALELPALFLFGAITLFFAGGGEYASSSNNKWD